MWHRSDVHVSVPRANRRRVSTAVAAGRARASEPFDASARAAVDASSALEQSIGDPLPTEHLRERAVVLREVFRVAERAGAAHLVDLPVVGRWGQLP